MSREVPRVADHHGAQRHALRRLFRVWLFMGRAEDGRDHMTPDTKAALAITIVAVLIWTPSLADRAWRRLNRWIDSNVDSLVEDALSNLHADDLRLHPDVRQMRQQQVAASSDWSLWREEMTS